MYLLDFRELFAVLGKVTRDVTFGTFAVDSSTVSTNMYPDRSCDRGATVETYERFQRFLRRVLVVIIVVVMFVVSNVFM